MTSTHFYDTAIEILAPDAAIEIDCEYIFTYSPGYPASGPTYDCGGEPAEGPEVEIIGIRLYGRDPLTQKVTDLECPKWLQDQIISGADYDALRESVESYDERAY